MEGKNIFVREIVGQWDMLLIRDKLLYRKWVTGQGNDIFKTVIPVKERRKVLFFCHDFKGSGHLGHKATGKRTKQILLAWMQKRCYNIRCRLREVFEKKNSKRY